LFQRYEHIAEFPQRKPEFPSTYDETKRTWRHITKVLWVRSLSSLRDLPAVQFYATILWSGLRISLQPWPVNPKDDRHVGAMIGLASLPSYKLRENAINAGKHPLQLRAEGFPPQSPEDQWERLVPELQQTGWDVNRYERLAYKVVPIADLELVEGPIPLELM
jgi:hypothetical protein